MANFAAAKLLSWLPRKSTAHLVPTEIKHQQLGEVLCLETQDFAITRACIQKRDTTRVSRFRS